MRTQSICLALAIVLICPFASAQIEQTMVPNDQRVPHLAVTGTNVFPNAPHPFRTDKFTRDVLQRSTPPIRKTLLPQSQTYVIDTAIVLGERWGRGAIGDTTKHVYSFSAKAKRTSDLTQTLASGLWLDVQRETNTYDASNNMLSDLKEYWSNGQWVNSECNTYTYDAQGNMLSDLYEQWSTGQLLNSWGHTYTYDANGNVLTDLRSTGRWGDSLRNTYTYDPNGNMLSDLYEQFVWSYGSDYQWVWVWSSLWRYTYTNDANGHRLSELYEVPYMTVWLNSASYTYTYDANGNRLSELDEYWSLDQSAWVNSQRETYAYDARGNRLSELDEYWSNGQWVTSSRNTYIYTYDANGNLTSLWHGAWGDTSWNPSSISFGLSDSAGNYYDFGQGYNFTLIRKLIATGVACQSENVPASYSLSQNYPNPFNPSTTIKFELPHASQVSLTVYDVLGRQVSVLVNDRRDAGAHEVKFDALGLASGVYFYRLHAGDFTQTKRFLLLK